MEEHAVVMQPEKQLVELRVLYIQEEDGRWSAQCLEYDVVAQARKLTELQYEFEKTLMSYLVLSDVEGYNVLEKLGPAPEEFWNLWEQHEASELQFSLEKESIRPEKPISVPFPKQHVRVAEPLPA